MSGQVVGGLGLCSRYLLAMVGQVERQQLQVLLKKGTYTVVNQNAGHLLRVRNDMLLEQREVTI